MLLCCQTAAEFQLVVYAGNSFSPYSTDRQIFSVTENIILCHLDGKCGLSSIWVTFQKLLKVSKQILKVAKVVARCFLKKKVANSSNKSAKLAMILKVAY